MPIFPFIYPMETAPRTQRILLLYWPRLYGRKKEVDGWYEGWHRTSHSKWEEVRWVDNKDKTGSDPHWEEWCGEDSVHSSNHIDPSDCIGWMHRPTTGDER